MTDFYLGNYCRLIKARRHGQWWILKCLKPEFMGQPFYENLLEKEYYILTLLNHPYIVRAVSMEEVTPYGPSIVMEYLDGITLDLVSTDRKTKQKLTEQMLEAVSYLHSIQIVHRDLKPQNIVVTNNGKNLKIIDFGLSDTDNYAVLKQSAGTSAYMAPEQRETSIPDMRNDVYSLGIIMKEMQLGWLYSRIISKCTGKRNSRYAEACELLRSFKKASALPLKALIVFSTLALVVNLLWTGIISTQTLEETIRIDSMIVERHHVDTILIDHTKAQETENKYHLAYKEGCKQIDNYMHTHGYQEIMQCPDDSIIFYNTIDLITQAGFTIQKFISNQNGQLTVHQCNDLNYSLSLYFEDTYLTPLMKKNREL